MKWSTVLKAGAILLAVALAAIFVVGTSVTGVVSTKSVGKFAPLDPVDQSPQPVPVDQPDSNFSDPPD